MKGRQSIDHLRMVDSILDCSGPDRPPRGAMSLLGLVLVSRVGAQVAQVEEAQQLQHGGAVHLPERSG